MINVPDIWARAEHQYRLLERSIPVYLPLIDKIKSAKFASFLWPSTTNDTLNAETIPGFPVKASVFVHAKEDAHWTVHLWLRRAADPHELLNTFDLFAGVLLNRRDGTGSNAVFSTDVTWRFLEESCAMWWSRHDPALKLLIPLMQGIQHHYTDLFSPVSSHARIGANICTTSQEKASIWIDTERGYYNLELGVSTDVVVEQLWPTFEQFADIIQFVVDHRAAKVTEEQGTLP